MRFDSRTWDFSRSSIFLPNNFQEYILVITRSFLGNMSNNKMWVGEPKGIPFVFAVYNFIKNGKKIRM